MKYRLRCFTRFKALVFALGVFIALPALGHSETFIGKFTLANETHWGGATLAPGDYDFSLEAAVSPSRVVVREAHGKAVAILISMWSTGMSSTKANRLELETSAGEVYVSALYLSDMDTELHFNV